MGIVSYEQAVSHRRSVQLQDSVAFREQSNSFDAFESVFPVASHSLEYFRRNPGPGASATDCHPRMGLQLLTAIMQQGNLVREYGEEHREMFEGFLLPTAGLPDADGRHAVNGVYDVNAEGLMCANGETYFGNTQRQATRPGYYGQPKISVYHTEEGLPVLLRKSREARTAMTLTDVALGPIVFPPGMIVRVAPSMNEERTGRKRGIRGLRQTFAIDDLHIRFARASAWAYPAPLDRALFAVSEAYNLYERVIEKLNMLTSLDLDDFRYAAERIMRSCGVKPAPREEAAVLASAASQINP